jgi:hypothetical protein
MPRKRRRPVEGYPKHFVFECREDVDSYLGGDKIICLLCGLDFRGLGPHLSAVHLISDDQYREKYGLPYKRGLVSAASHALMSESAKKCFADNKEAKLEYLGKAKAVQAEFGNPQRNKPTFWKKERTVYELVHYEEFVRRVIGGRTVMEVSEDEGMPTVAHVYHFMKKNEEFAKQYNSVIPLTATAGFSKKDRENRRKKAGVTDDFELLKLASQVTG